MTSPIISGRQQKGPLSFSYAAHTDMGRVRENNEDHLILHPESGLFGVCDGMGGHAAGEVASQIAAERLKKYLGPPNAGAAESLKSAIERVNRDIFEDQREHLDRMGMGTTLSVLWLASRDTAASTIGHVGDSRVYLMRGGELEQLTIDHSPVFEMFLAGSIKKSELRFHPHKSLLTRSLGVHPDVEVDIVSMTPQPTDLFLLCSDGLVDHLDDEEIGERLQQGELDDMAAALVESANRAGGRDNISVVLVKIGETG